MEDTQLKQILASLELLAQGQHALIQKVDKLDDKVDKLDAKVNQLDAKVNQLDAKVNQLDTKVSQLDAKVDQLDNKVTSMELEMREKFGAVFDGLNMVGHRFGAMTDAMDHGFADVKLDTHYLLRRVSATDAMVDEVKTIQSHTAGKPWSALRMATMVKE